MKFKIIALVLILAIINISCTTTTDKTFKEELYDNGERIVSVILVSGDVIDFGRNEGTYVRETNTIVGYDRNQVQRTIPMDDVLYVRIKKVDPVLTTLFVIGCVASAAGLTLLIILLTKKSCPFIYSYDGEKYVFDAEPLGGVIAEGLAKTEFSKMKHLKEVQGKYKFMISNEVEETQYIDMMKLVTVDHSPGTEVIADYSGNLIQVGNITPPLTVKDENGKDLSKFFAKRDLINWMSYIPKDGTIKTKDTKNHLTLTFPKPADAKKAKLIFNVGTSQWGSNMISEMLQLRGRDIDKYYNDIKSLSFKLKAKKYFEDEETYLLRINVKNGAQSETKGWLQGAGPLVIEDRILSLDISAIKGETLTIELNPAIGFWSMDFIGISYDDTPQEFLVTELSPVLAKGDKGNDLTTYLDKIDKSYVTLPETGNRFMMEFEAPPLKKGMERIVYMKTHGYYEIHLDKSAPPKLDLLSKIQLTPGKVVEYSLEKFNEWRKNSTAKK